MGHKTTFVELQKEITPKNVLTRVTVLVLCTLSDDALYFY